MLSIQNNFFMINCAVLDNNPSLKSGRRGRNIKVLLSAPSAAQHTNSYLTCFLYLDSLSLSLNLLNLHTQSHNRSAECWDHKSQRLLNLSATPSTEIEPGCVFPETNPTSNFSPGATATEQPQFLGYHYLSHPLSFLLSLSLFLCHLDSFQTRHLDSSLRTLCVQVCVLKTVSQSHSLLFDRQREHNGW